MNYSENNKQSHLKEKGPRFYSSPEEQKMMRLKEAVSRTDEEKFFFLMHLMKLQQGFQQGLIQHKK